ncbi:DoxX family protein [Dermatophilus congolensis]|uniref:DoxX family protein n=1 Tax=Dermatophilus congolensis TaxID=1863 RepID=UPI00312CA91B
MNDPAVDEQTRLSRQENSGDAAAGDRLARYSPWIGLVARFVLGGAFLLAGFSKIFTPLASARSVQAYQIFPFEVAAVIGYALPVVEIALGLLIVFGLFTRWTALLGTVIMVIFIIGIASAWARGLTIDCGCFGDGGFVEPGKTKYPQDIARDVVFVAAGAWLLWRPVTALSLDAWLSRRAG